MAKQSGKYVVDRITILFTRFLPQPLTIAILLTFLVFLLAFFATDNQQPPADRLISLFQYWEAGVWDAGGLEFAMQMMLMLVLGHILALSAPAGKLINLLATACTSSARAAFIVTLSTLFIALFNWGLGLIFGAVLARKVGEYAQRNNIPLNYPLIGAAGYSGLMIWHAGISGSSLVKVAEPGAMASMMSGSGLTPETIAQIPKSLPLNATVFSDMNMTAIGLTLLVLPFLMMRVGRKLNPTSLPEPTLTHETEVSVEGPAADKARWFAMIVALFIAIAVIITANKYLSTRMDLGFITPNFLNLLLLGLAIGLHRNLYSFLQALEKAITGCSGILIQFPLYFGIMGVMKGSGLMLDISEFFISISNSTTYPLLSYASAGITNFMVPSGGGQWAVQGPVIIEGAMQHSVPLHKAVLSLAYGDQITNMLQPFWALPLLGITGLKAQQILPFTLILMLAGGSIYGMVLLLF